MSDTDSPVAESPLDRLRRLAKESSAAKAAAAHPAQEPVFEEPAFEEPAFEEPVSPVTAVAETVPNLPPVEEPSPPDLTAESPRVPEAEPDQAARPAPPSPARRRTGAPEPVPATTGTATAEELPPPTVLTPDGEPATTPRSLKVLCATLAGLVVLALVGLVFSIRHERHSADAAKERAAATAAAVRVVSDTTTLDYRNLDDWLRRVQADSTDGSTPGKGLRSDFANEKDSLASVTAGRKSVSVGSVVKSVYCGGFCATAQVAGNTAAALVYGTAHVTSTTVPAGTTQIDRFTVKLIKVNGQWLATNVDDVGVAPTS